MVEDVYAYQKGPIYEGSYEKVRTFAGRNCVGTAHNFLPDSVVSLFSALSGDA